MRWLRLRWIDYFDDGFFVLVVRDLFLPDVERDFTLPVARNKASVLQAVEQILDASPLGVNVE